MSGPRVGLIEKPVVPTHNKMARVIKLHIRFYFRCRENSNSDNLVFNGCYCQCCIANVSVTYSVSLVESHCEIAFDPLVFLFSLLLEPKGFLALALDLYFQVEGAHAFPSHKVVEVKTL